MIRPSQRRKLQNKQRRLLILTATFPSSAYQRQPKPWRFLRDDEMPAAKNPARGSDLPQSKLTKQIVADIRSKAPTTTQRALAAEYGVHVNTIWQVVNYATWYHVA
jgi:hypothetical protein